MSSISAIHTANFVKDCLDDWYPEDYVSICLPASYGFDYTYKVEECYTVSVDSSGNMTLSTSRFQGPPRVWSGKFLDLLVDEAEKEFPAMQRRTIIVL
jgi:hypothetical protein